MGLSGAGGSSSLGHPIPEQTREDRRGRQPIPERQQRAGEREKEGGGKERRKSRLRHGDGGRTTQSGQRERGDQGKWQPRQQRHRDREGGGDREGADGKGAAWGPGRQLYLRKASSGVGPKLGWAAGPSEKTSTRRFPAPEVAGAAAGGGAARSPRRSAEGEGVDCREVQVEVSQGSAWRPRPRQPSPWDSPQC